MENPIRKPYTTLAIASHVSSELEILGRLIYLNKNQHRSERWFNKVIQQHRWGTKILKMLESSTYQVLPLEQSLSKGINAGLNAYNALTQNLARTAFMSTCMLFIACIARLRELYECALSEVKPAKTKPKTVVKVLPPHTSSLRDAPKAPETFIHLPSINEPAVHPPPSETSRSTGNQKGPAPTGLSVESPANVTKSQTSTATGKAHKTLRTKIKKKKKSDAIDSIFASM